MELFSEIFIYSEQPTNCPYCGASSEIILDLSHTPDQTQIHKCMNVKCENEFVMQYDEEFDNGALL
ncbi:MAG: CPXCG motif-containing cysteine-rich protein [Bacteroidetes bacterium]|nr:CPXCG motif-containing cysteine-rich protein [Bacteroidota bacterium]